MPLHRQIDFVSVDTSVGSRYEVFDLIVFFVLTTIPSWSDDSIRLKILMTGLVVLYCVSEFQPYDELVTIYGLCKIY